MSGKRRAGGELDLTNELMAYEAGVLDQNRIVALFQHLVDTGLAWQLQGHYGRTAIEMIGEGILLRGERPQPTPGEIAESDEPHSPGDRPVRGRLR